MRVAVGSARIDLEYRGYLPMTCGREIVAKTRIFWVAGSQSLEDVQPAATVLLYL